MPPEHVQPRPQTIKEVITLIKLLEKLQEQCKTVKRPSCHNYVLSFEFIFPLSR